MVIRENVNGNRSITRWFDQVSENSDTKIGDI